MESHRFDALIRSLTDGRPRRAVLPVLGSVLTVPAFGLLPAGAKKKKKKKTTLCKDGQTIQASKKKKKKLLKSGATPGACASPPPGCAPQCSGTTCGGDDGCGGICNCAAGSLCHSGVCHACTVTCSANSSACGAELQTALTGGGTVYACPGRYVGSYTLDVNVALIGAGEGNDPASNTILDANQGEHVMRVSSGVITALHGLHITGGSASAGGGAISSQGTLSLTACAVNKNKSSGFGGGIYHHTATGPLTLTNCTVSQNSGLHGGGIYHTGKMEIRGSAISGNASGTSWHGGGIYSDGFLTFDIASSVTGNTASSGGGIFNYSGSVELNGATVSGNTPDNCAAEQPSGNVAGCTN